MCAPIVEVLQAVALDAEFGRGANHTLVQRSDVVDVGREDRRVQLPLPEGLDQPGQVVLDSLRLDLAGLCAAIPDGGLNAVQSDFRDPIRALVVAEWIEELRERAEGSPRGRRLLSGRRAERQQRTGCDRGCTPKEVTSVPLHRGLLQREADDRATCRDGDVLASVELVDHR